MLLSQHRQEHNDLFETPVEVVRNEVYTLYQDLQQRITARYHEEYVQSNHRFEYEDMLISVVLHIVYLLLTHEHNKYHDQNTSEEIYESRKKILQ